MYFLNGGYKTLVFNFLYLTALMICKIHYIEVNSISLKYSDLLEYVRIRMPPIKKLIFFGILINLLI